jgi:hypothetical protein
MTVITAASIQRRELHLTKKREAAGGVGGKHTELIPQSGPLCGEKSPGKKRRRARGQRRINKRLAMVSPLAAGGGVSVGPRYRDLRGPIAGEAVVTLATPEYPFRLPVAPLTRTR